ncbi:hypothetical protein THRCLA_20467, partial [Thraustotheca clavata]
MMLDHVLAGSLCFLGMAICMYIKFIRRQEASFEQVRPSKQVQSPPAISNEYTVAAMELKPPPKQTNALQYVYQHPMRRRTHSSMSGKPEIPKAPDTPTVIEIDTNLGAEKTNPYYAKQAYPYSDSQNKLEDGFQSTERGYKNPLSPRSYRTMDEMVKTTPIVISPTKSETDLFASETDSLLRLENQNNTPKSPFGAPLKEVFPPPLHRQASPNDDNLKRIGPFIKNEHQQPAQMQLEVARQAHIPLFLHMPLHVHKGIAPRAAEEKVLPTEAPPRGNHAEKRPSKGASFNFRIEFEDITLGELIGQGAFGTVHKGIWRDTLVAVKILQCQQLTADI